MNRRLVLALATACAGAYGRTPCEKLKSLSLPSTTITAAELVPAVGPLPAYCGISATIAPSTDSQIGVELRLPSAIVWNGKFEAVGNGAWAGVFSTAAMEAALKEGFA